MQRIKRNANCLLLCMVMLLGMLPADALATADEEAVFYEEVVIHNLGEEALEICEDDSFSPYVVSDTGSSIYYGRNALAQMSNSAAYLFAYDQIVAGIDSAAEEISVYDKVHPITTSEINMVMDAYRRDYTQHFWLGNSYRYSFSSKTVINLYPAYNMTGSALDEAKVKFEAAAEKILTGITPDMTEYEKELYLHDAIAGIASYAEGDNAHNAYGALVDGIAVCEGYAEALQYLLHRVGIRSFIIIGDAGGPHAWNMVRIDGKYYHVDLTWDDQDENTYYAYFNITDRQLQQDHTIGATAYTLPACTATDAFYYNGKDTYLDNYTVDQVAKLLRDYDLNVQLYISDGAAEFWNWFVTNKNQILPLVGIRDSCSSGCSMMGNEMILSFSGLGVKLTDGDSVSFYATAEKALRYASNDSRLKLLSAVSENVSSELRLSLDLNGYDINGSLTGNNITVFDSQTDDYTINNGNGYGVITGIVTGVATAEGYLPVTDENGTSYHRFNVSLDKLVLKAEQAGLYYTGSFQYDEVVAQNMSACGVILSTQNKMPVADDSDPGSRYTVSGNSVLVKNILSQSNAISDNNKNAIKPVHGRAYLKLKDGRIFYSTTKTSNLKTMVEAVDAGAWDKLSQPQKNALLQMYQSYADTMNNWNISNLKSA